MKKLLLISIITSTCVSASVSNSCNITLYKKKFNSKTYYTLQGESISKKVIAKLAPSCKFSMKLMTEAQKREMKIKRLKSQLKKLGAK